MSVGWVNLHSGFESSNEEDTIAAAARLAGELKGGEWIALSGELGAGKTRFVRGLAQGLGCDPADVSSPTFVLMNEYVSREPGRPRLIHIDAYRAASAEDLDTMGLDEALHHAPGEPAPVVAVEWPERIQGALPADCVRVRIEHLPGDNRRVTIVRRERA
jgi:tRNA threonylcarbamoyladenosine biosynthesis protein TsaE